MSATLMPPPTATFSSIAGVVLAKDTAVGASFTSLTSIVNVSSWVLLAESVTRTVTACEVPASKSSAPLTTMSFPLIANRPPALLSRVNVAVSPGSVAESEPTTVPLALFSAIVVPDNPISVGAGFGAAAKMKSVSTRVLGVTLDSSSVLPPPKLMKVLVPALRLAMAWTSARLKIPEAPVRSILSPWPRLKSVIVSAP